MQDRLAKQGALGTETATVDVAQKILNVLDTYDRAFQSVEAATNEEVEIVDAYKKTYDMILEAFAELNVTKVETVGVEFDYEMHQAIMQMPSDEYEEGIVCQEFAMGWKCGEKLIRPAMVAVAAWGCQIKDERFYIISESTKGNKLISMVSLIYRSFYPNNIIITIVYILSFTIRDEF